jgi:hypothetical protein
MSSAKLLYDRNLLVSSKKKVRADLALKFAKQELDGELSLGTHSSASMPRAAGAPAAATASSQQKRQKMDHVSSLPTGLEEMLAAELKGNSPIIILPSASNSKARLSSLNAVEFLQNGTYAEPDSKKMKRPETMPLEIEKTICGRPFRFRLFDDTSRFRKDDWKAVVAVFSDGKMWQFSGWPFRSEADLFSTFQVFHLRYSDDPVDPALAGSRVKPLLLRRGASYQDSSVMIEFWKQLEIFLGQPKSSKFSSTQKLP